jgi:cyanophycin synthetase
MRQITFKDVQAMKGNGSSMRFVLKSFFERGAEVFIIHESVTKETIERYFIVKYQGLTIPLRANNLNFYSVYNSALSLTITNDKLKSQDFLEEWGIPTPATQCYDDDHAAGAFLAEHDTVVVKPRVGAHGEGITVGLTSPKQLTTAIEAAKRIHPDVFLQQQVTGDDHRLLFVDYKFVAAVKRTPAAVTGDGQRTVQQLVKAENQRKTQLLAAIRRGSEEADATKGSISPTPLEEVIAARGQAFLATIPKPGEMVSVVDKANVSLGGQTHDITDRVNRELTDQISRLLKNIELKICGVDVLSTDIASAPDQRKSFVIELNGAPGLRLHEQPMEGQARPVCALVADSLIAYYKK